LGGTRGVLVYPRKEKHRGSFGKNTERGSGVVLGEGADKRKKTG